MKRKREIATGLMILAIATVFGQATPPPDAAKPDEKQDAQPVKADEPKANVVLGWSAWGVSANENKFRQYASAPKGLFLREFSYSPSYLGKHDAFLDIKAPWQDDYRLDGSVRLFNGSTILKGSDYRNRFFNSNPIVLTGNDRHIQEALVKQKITSGFSLLFQAKMDEQRQSFPAPADQYNQKTRTWNASAQGSLWKDGFIDLSYTDWRYWDRTQVLADTDMQRWSAGLTHQFGSILSLNGSISRSMIHQPSIGLTSKVDQWSIGGQLYLGEDTALLGEIHNEKLDLPTVQNAFDKTRDSARARIVHNFGNGWSGQFGYSELALQRVNAAHTYVDDPKWHTFDVQFSGKLSPSLRLSAKGSRASMEGGAGMETDDPRALYWRNRWSGEIKLDASSEFVNGYLVFGLHDDRNDVRDVRVRNQNLTFGASFQAKPELELYFESSFDMWSGVTSDPLNPNLNSYFPDGTTFTVGANWTIDEHMFATANYTLFTTNNDNPLGLPGGNVRGNTFTGSLNYKTPSGYEIGLTFAPWQYSDRLYSNLGYSTGMIQLTARARF